MAENQKSKKTQISDHIACLQEPYYKGDVPGNIPQTYQTYYSNKEPKPRATIQVSKPFCEGVMFHENFSNRDTCTISIKDPNDPNKRTFISSVYMHDSEDIDKHFVNEVLKMTAIKKMGLIICADTNAHSTIWGNNENNQRGDKLENLIIDHNLEIVNTVFTPTWSRGDYSSTIDLTMINIFAPKIKSWEILTGTSESDHEIIQFVIDSNL